MVRGKIGEVDLMFAKDEWERLIHSINKKEKKYLEIILKTTYGPTDIERNFEQGLKNRGINIEKIINWWSACSPFGILEIEIGNGYVLFAIWNQGDKNQILSIISKEEINLSFLLDSLASSIVYPGVMRTFSHARFPGG